MHLCGLLAVVLSLTYVTGASGLPASWGRSLIVGGENARQGDWPWMAHLNISNGSKRWRCGGSLLNKLWVLTSAHCVDPKRQINQKKSMIWLGSYNLREASKFYRGIEYIILHPEYTVLPVGFLNNIALLKMSKEVEFMPQVFPVVLPGAQDNFGPASECWILGWGYIDNGVPLRGQETLQQLRVPVVSSGQCSAVYRGFTENMLCAGKGGKDACDGDFGGPLVCSTPRGIVQAGVISYGNPRGCGIPGFPGVYTKVIPYLDFISYTMSVN